MLPSRLAFDCMRALTPSLVIAGLVFSAVWAAANVADPTADLGQNVFAICAACHGADQPTRTGPELKGVIGRAAGTVRGFRYSRALKNAKLVWSEETLDRYLADPQAAIPGNAMPFPGLPNKGERQAVITFLKTLQ